MRAETVTITCPCCEHEIEVTVLPSEPRTHDHPGAAADYEDPRGCSCSCYLSGRLADQYEAEVLSRAIAARTVAAPAGVGP